MTDFSVCILAGGKSRRMGTDKAFVYLHERPMIEHVYERISPLASDDVFLIANYPAPYQSLGVPIHPDIYPDCGPLGGIYTALTHATHNNVLIVACDMPFLQPPLLRYLIDIQRKSDHSYDIIVPEFQGQLQGVHALYYKSCMPLIERRLEQGILRLNELFEHAHLRVVPAEEFAHLDPGGVSFININTPTDLSDAQNMIQAYTHFT